MEVGVLHNTYEAGEPTRGTPWREGSTGHGNVRGKDGGDIELQNRINET